MTVYDNDFHEENIELDLNTYTLKILLKTM